MTNQTLYITRGLPASGKSTWCREKALETSKPMTFDGEYQSTIILSKDDIRQKLHMGVWSRENEKEVVEYQAYSAEFHLRKGYTVFIDDTNIMCQGKHIERFRSLVEQVSATTGLNIKFEIVDFTHVNVDVCLDRDATRPNPVGSEVIYKMAKSLKRQQKAKALKTDVRNYRKQDTWKLGSNWGDTGFPKQHAVVFDMDGTLSLMNNRSPFDSKACINDNPNVPIILMLNNMRELGYKILIVSGRHDHAKEETEQWCAKYNVPFDGLHMRKTGDNRKDSIIKREIAEKLLEDYVIDYVFDDRNQVVEMWRDLGLCCLQVHTGDF